MRRREFIAGLGGAVGWPLAARAQQPAIPIVGYLNSASASINPDRAQAFRDGLSENGFVEGRNVAIEYRWAENQFDRLPRLAKDLVGRSVSVIATGDNAAAALAAKAATPTIPIVFVTGVDPVAEGFVASVNRPGGNITGATSFSTLLNPKKLELLHEIVPTASVTGVLINRSVPGASAAEKDIEEAARALGLRLEIVDTRSDRDLEPAFSNLAKQGVGALLVRDDAFFTNQRERLVALTTRYAIPAIFYLREFVLSGGLISYGSRIADLYHQVGIYAARILNGVKPADLPILQPTKFELVINLKTAKALGLTIPETLLATADQVIE
jgi:putative ABC transport system substrate-binding protein